jgi:predicted DNA-binding transcriptional regulator YafY
MQRIYQIDQVLSGRPFVPRAELQERLSVSWATLKRDLSYMKDRLNAPIVFDRDLGGYRFGQDAKVVGPKYELPGLWFSAPEIHALLTMQQLLTDLDTGGLIGPQIKPLLSRLTGLLGAADNPVDEVKKRIRIHSVGTRHVQLEHFQRVGAALVNRKRLLIRYHARGSNETTEREISPQRLVHYRSNWYLDAWCHLRDDLRAFSVDAVKSAMILEKRAKDVSEKRLAEVLGAGYGIFKGAQVEWATLRFTPERARWVSCELWHPDQQGRWLEDGGWELKVPYSDHRELMMDVLKHGAECEVVGPAKLRDKVLIELTKVINTYAPKHV